ncbi:ribonuclease P protein subunit [Candidatus Woesearchaeota archaeon]|nr:ribonuclease P protein subunit [Candidatus Woesearchaeota archaeon]MBI2130924.1 ribonuclease P protein subunit [Candidatus Woesearchaeota archaeon]MBI2660968.1 ribonuclease P protein subunit [Candidatus Woesearchaeota archaeon]
MQSSHRLLRGEFIGKQVEVENTGIRGTIINETKNTFLVASGKSRKDVPKKGNKFMFNIMGNNVKVEGNDIASRPEDRIKMRIAKKWKARISD